MGMIFFVGFSRRFLLGEGNLFGETASSGAFDNFPKACYTKLGSGEDIPKNYIWKLGIGCYIGNRVKVPNTTRVL